MMEYTALEKNTMALAAMLSARMDHAGLPSIGANGNWWIGQIDTGIRAIPENKPSIDADGTWKIGDISTGIPADTALPEGADVPSIGNNGNWWVGDMDTGISAKPGDKPTLGTEGTIVINGSDTGISPLPAERFYCTVSYVSAYGSAPSPKVVLNGYKLKEEDLPTLTAQGISHICWLGDGERIAAGYKVRADISLTAQWSDTDYTSGYSAGYAQSQLDGASAGSHPDSSLSYIPHYRALYINVITDAAGDIYEIEEKGQRWDQLPESSSTSYVEGYKDGYKYGYKYAAQSDGEYIGVLEYVWDDAAAMLAVNEETGYVSELPENTYAQGG